MAEYADVREPPTGTFGLRQGGRGPGVMAPPGPSAEPAASA